jgi:transposase
MGRPHPVELRLRVVAFVDEGHGHREAARHFRGSPRFVNDMVKLRRETGGLAPKRQGNLARVHGVTVHRSAVGRWLHRLGLSHKKTLRAAEQQRPDVARARRIWITRRQPFMSRALERLVFIDETSLNTKLVKTTGWAPVGERLVDHAPFGHWHTQTFIASLRHDGLTAP